MKPLASFVSTVNAVNAKFIESYPSPGIFMKPRFDNTYAALPERFYSRQKPEPVSSPSTIVVNEPLARRLGFDPQWLKTEEGAEFGVGNRLLEGSDPIAMVYAGHQFGNWVPRLGDGRALLLGEVVDEEGERFDIQLKGSGRTPYSRRGDGRAPLGPVVREYLISEAMAAMGVPTTRALMAATTGESVFRETRLPGGVLVRVASSHIRIGTFEYFASQRDTEALQLLIDYVIDRHYPDLAGATPIDLLRRVAEQQAELVAQWQLLGFIHGVMNTDNMLLSGETIDYGPCAFMNEYDPATVYSSIDRQGRYAFGNQPFITQWNISRLAHAFLALPDGEELLDDAQKVVDDVRDLFRDAYGRGMAKKLGIAEFQESDWPLIEDLLELMYETGSDYTLTFRGLTRLATSDDSDSDGSDPEASDDDLAKLTTLPDEFDPWIERWQARQTEEPANNPLFIPRNHLVEAAIDDAVEREDFSTFFDLLDVVKTPYDERSDWADFARPPKPDERVQATFCGT